jgi:integrase
VLLCRVTMASLIKRPTSKFWVAAFRDAQGRQHRRSTGEIDRKRALAAAEKLELVAQRRGNPQRVRQAFAEFFKDQYGQDVPFLNVRDFTGRWLAARKAETSPATFRRYDEVVRKFLRFLGTAADRGLDEINKGQILAFRDAQIASSLAAATTNTALRIVRMVFRSARREGYLWQDPAEGVKSVKGAPTIKRRPFTIDELRRILAVAGPEWQSLIKLGLYSGQRLADVATLTWAQIDLERDEIALTTRKTDKRLLVPIAPPLREHLLSLAGADNPRTPVHPRAFELVRAGRVATLSNQFGELLVDAGLREPRNHESRGIGGRDKRAGMDVSYHCLRHTAVSLLKDAGVPSSVVMALVGHDSVSVSQHYTHVGAESLSRAAATLPRL